MRKGKKTKPKSNKTSFDIDEFAVGDQEIAKLIAAKEHKRLMSDYQLNKLIDQASGDAPYLIDKKVILPQSPHILNLSEQLRKEKTTNQVMIKVGSKHRRTTSQKATIVKQEKKPAKKKLTTIKFTAWFKKPIFVVKQINLVFKYRNFSRLAVVQLIRTLLLFSKVCLIGLVNIFKIIILKATVYRQSIIRFVRDRRSDVVELKQRIKQLAPVKFRTRRLALFILVAIMLVAPYGLLNFYSGVQVVKGRVLGISQNAAEQWEQGFVYLAQGNWQQAADEFTMAGRTFASARLEISHYNRALLNVLAVLPVTGKVITSSQNLITIGEGMSAIIAKFSLALEVGTTDTDQDFDQKLLLLADYIDDINKNYQELRPLINQVDLAVLPAQYRPLFQIWQQQNDLLANWLSETDQTLHWLIDVLGQTEPTRYLLMFQNSNEIRATGGFMGSFALLDINKGKIDNLDIPAGGTYDLKSQLKEFVISPYPHHLLGTRWQTWDVNWWPDWPTTASKIAWFYERSGGPTVDGVIAINSSVISTLLGFLGSIELPEYNKVLSADNVILSLQHAIEFEYDKDENKPKQIIADLAPIILDNIYNLSAQQIIQLGDLLNKHLINKDIQLYFNDKDRQQFVIKKGWAGDLKDTSGDYLNVIVQNIGGGKSDSVIEQTVDYHLTVGPDNYLIGKARIVRQHNGNPNDVFARQRNVAFIRIYVPLGSELITVEGATEPEQKLFKDIPDFYEADNDLIKLDGINYYHPFDKYYETEQFNKKVFGQWLMLDPGETKELTFIYRLPIKVSEDQPTSLFDKLFLSTDKKLNYSLYFETQSGIGQQNFRFSFKIPNNTELKWMKDSRNGMYRLGNWLYSDQDILQDYQLGFILN